eukprot:16340888-Heterocapsa_arctica.AAC.1
MRFSSSSSWFLSSAASGSSSGDSSQLARTTNPWAWGDNGSVLSGASSGALAPASGAVVVVAETPMAGEGASSSPHM